MHEKRNDGELHFTRTHLAAEVFGAAPHHLAGQKDADDQEQQEMIMPTPLPPNTQFSHIPTNGERLAIGLRLSCSAFTAPQVTSVVTAANTAPAELPKRSSLPRDYRDAARQAGSPPWAV